MKSQFKFANLSYETEQEELTEKTKKRRRILKNIFRNNREMNADKEFELLCELDKELYTGYTHHRIGAFCLQENQLEKAEQLLLKAKEIIQKKFVFSSVYKTLANLYMKKKDYKKAIQYFEKVIEMSPHNNPKAHSEGDQIIFSGKLNSFKDFVDSHTDLAVIFVQLSEFEKALDYCKRTLQLNPQQTEAMTNYSDIMRQLGKKQEAIDYTWKSIVEHTKSKTYQAFTPIEINPWLPSELQQIKDKKINILCMKWGTRYPTHYVNKLYSSIKRNTSWETVFYCFTDDPTGLNQNIKAQKLEEGWEGWWGKVTLFNAEIEGKKFYIDLDMVITGNLDKLFEYDGQFAILRSGDFACQKNHKEGYNSSIMIWKGDFLKPVYKALKGNFQVIKKFIVRFDYWLQMTVNNADYIQNLYPGKVIDYITDAKQELSKQSSVVCFAGEPKPEDCPAKWINDHWIQ